MRYKDDSKHTKYILDAQHEYRKIEDTVGIWRSHLKEESWILGKHFTYANLIRKN
jgi:hypothetical protein